MALTRPCGDRNDAAEERATVRSAFIRGPPGRPARIPALPSGPVGVTTAPMPSHPLKKKPAAEASADPRRRRGFLPRLFPLCDGATPPPPGAAGTVARRKIEFLTAYYKLNVLYAELEAVRRKRGSAQALLKKIAEALRARDQLEDRCAPEGFLGEPEMDGLFCRNVRFTHARAAAPESSFSLFVPLVLPKGLTLRQYIERELGLPASGSRRPKKAAMGGR